MFRLPCGPHRASVALLSAFLLGLVASESPAKASRGAAASADRGKAAFNVEDWPQGIASFVRLDKAGMPVFRNPQYTRAGSNLIGYSLAGEIVQYRDKTMVITFSNPLGTPAGSDGTWYQVAFLNGTAGWVLPGTHYPIVEFTAERWQPELIGTWGDQIERKVFRFANPVSLTGPRGTAVMTARKGGVAFVHNEDSQFVELGTFKQSLGVWKKSDVSGWVETIPWYTAWDEIAGRRLPALLWLVSPLLFLILSLAIVYSDPAHAQKQGRKVLAFLWFGAMALGSMTGALGDRLEYSLDKMIWYKRYDVLGQFVALWLLLPFLAVVAFFHEGFVTAAIRMRYFVSQQSVGEIMKARAKQKELDAKKKEFARKEETLSEREATVQNRLSTLRGDVLEIEVDVSPITDYEGYWGEVEKRFQQRQMLKTAKVAREHLEEVRKLCEEGAALQRARADLELAKVDLESVSDDIRIKKKERILKEKLVDRDILQTEQDMKMLKGAFRKKGREDFEL